MQIQQSTRWRGCGKIHFHQGIVEAACKNTEKEAPNIMSTQPELKSFRYQKAQRSPKSSAQSPLQAMLQDNKNQDFRDYYPQQEGSQLPLPVLLFAQKTTAPSILTFLMLFST